MSDGHAVGARDGRHATPYRRAARPGRIEITKINGSDIHQISTTDWRMLTLASAHGQRAPHAYVAHSSGIVVPTDGLFEPHDVEIGRSEERRVGKECRSRW